MLERIKNAVSAVGAARAAAGSLATLDRELRDRHAAAAKHVRDLALLPEPVDAVVANMRAAIDAAAAHFDAAYGQQLVTAFSHQIRIDDDLSTDVKKPQSFWSPTLTPSWQNLCWLNPEAMKATFERAIRACKYTPGIPITERASAIRQAQDQVRALEAEHEALVDEAAKSGIVLQHLPSVTARREAAARAIEIEERAAEHRRRLAQRVDDTYPQPAMRLGRSNYLKPGADDRVGS